MKKELVIMMMGVFLFLLPNFAKAETLWPVDVGNYWVLKEEDNPSVELEFTVTGQARVWGKVFSLLEVKETDPDDLEYDYNIALAKEVGDNWYLYEGKYPVTHFKQAPVGTVWRYIEPAGDVVIAEIIAVENVQTPAGLFTDCIRYHFIENPGTQDIYIWDIWIHPGTGIVKVLEDLQLGVEFQYTLLLTEYSIHE